MEDFDGLIEGISLLKGGGTIPKKGVLIVFSSTYLETTNLERTTNREGNFQRRA